MTPSSAMASCIIQIGRQSLTSSLSSDLDKITSQSNTWNMSFNPDKSHTVTLSLSKRSVWRTLPSTSLKTPWRRSVSNFWASHSAMIFQTNHLSKFICKAILRCAKSFLGKSELLSACKALIHNTMEYCTLLRTGTPASHLALIDAKESKVLKLIGTKLSVSDCSCSHSLCIPPPPLWSYTLCPLLALSLQGFCRAHMVCQ